MKLTDFPTNFMREFYIFKSQVSRLSRYCQVSRLNYLTYLNVYIFINK